MTEDRDKLDPSKKYRTTVYSFQFEDESRKDFVVLLRKSDLSFVNTKKVPAPQWARLENHKCEVCTLADEDVDNGCCPVAYNILTVADEFRDFISHTNVNVTVMARERTYSKETTLQDGLSSLLGIIMVTSGCPVMELLKPLVRFHLPFGTLEETVYRTFSMYLMAQYFLMKKGKPWSRDLKGLKDIYNSINSLNADFTARLEEAARHDNTISALVILNCFSIMVPFMADETLTELQSYFNAYFD